MNQCPKCAAAVEVEGARFCTVCGTALVPADEATKGAETPPPAGLPAGSADGPNPEVAAEQPDVGSAELLLELNDNRFRMAGHAGVLDVRLTNIGDAPLEAGRLSLASRLIDRPFVATFRLAPGRQVVRRIEFDPPKGGDYLLNVAVAYTLAGTPKAFTAQPTLMVLDPMDSPEQLVVNIGELVKVSAAEGGKVLGVNLETNVADLVKKGVIKTANDLMNLPMPDRYLKVDLEFDYGETERLRTAVSLERPRVGSGFGSRPAALDRASLTWQEANGRRVHAGLLALPYVRFGRHRLGNDVILRCLPRGEAHDARSMRISKDAHFVLRLTAAGAFAIQDEPPSRNGTTINGQLVLGEQPIEPHLYRPSRLDVAGGALKLRLDFRPTPPQGRHPYRPLMQDSEPALWTAGTRAGLRGLRVSRLDNLGPDDPNGEEYYVILYQWVHIGQSSGNAVVLRDASVDEIHARLLHFDGGFWLEALSPTEPTKVNGRLVGPHTLVPLVPGMALALGRVAADFGEWQQLYL